MTEKEYEVERAKLEVQQAESRVRVAKKELEHGKRKLQYDVDRALADYKKQNADMLLQVDKLTEAVTMAELALEMWKAHCKCSETKLEQGFDDNK